MNLYDNFNQTPTEFLLAVMHDRNVPLLERIDAARWLGFIELVPDILERISHFGELGLKEYFDCLPLDQQQELKNAVNGLLRCNALGIDQPLAWMPTKGNA